MIDKAVTVQNKQTENKQKPQTNMRHEDRLSLPIVGRHLGLRLLLRSHLYLWGSPSSSSAFPAISLGFTILLLLRSQLYLWGSPFFFFCVPSYISGVHLSSPSSSAFPAISLGFTCLLILLLRSQLHLWGSPIFFFFCVPSYISGVHLLTTQPQSLVKRGQIR